MNNITSNITSNDLISNLVNGDVQMNRYDSIFDVTIMDVIEGMGLEEGEKVLIMSDENWDVEHPETMTLEQLINTQGTSDFRVPTMTEIKKEKEDSIKLDKLINITERIGNGFKALKAVNAPKANLQKEYHAAKNEFLKMTDSLNDVQERFDAMTANEQRANSMKLAAWKKVFWGKAMIVKSKRDTSGQELGKIYETSNKYWSVINNLKEEANNLNMWNEFYLILNDETLGNRYWASCDNEEVDNSVIAKEKMDDDHNTMECIKDSHLLEEAVFNFTPAVNWAHADARLAIARLTEEQFFNAEFIFGA